MGCQEFTTFEGRAGYSSITALPILLKEDLKKNAVSNRCETRENNNSHYSTPRGYHGWRNYIRNFNG
ncbi:hypothetical protein SNE40_013286 [Patella caerulea]|uniref:Uncharacterized protein n=1 Tax=Patella caerulea TaxID=87958 RepID=A0AAN8PTC7_PATCE